MQLKTYFITGRNDNIYYKFSIFNNNLTLDRLQYLRDYSTLLYNESGKTQFIHEHTIYISNFFIKKIQKAKYFYIDSIFIYPPDFKQLIVILYRDKNSRKRFPDLYCLINNKKQEGYEL